MLSSLLSLLIDNFLLHQIRDFHVREPEESAEDLAIVLAKIRRHRVVELGDIAHPNRHVRQDALAHLAMIDLAEESPLPEMRVVVNLDAVEHGPGCDTCAL